MRGPGQVKEGWVPYLCLTGIRGYAGLFHRENLQIISEQKKKGGGGGAHVVLESLPFIATTCRSAHKQGGSKGTGFYPSLCSINP